jgi:hypothetical protein
MCKHLDQTDAMVFSHGAFQCVQTRTGRDLVRQNAESPEAELGHLSQKIVRPSDQNLAK